jgi:hypothetical protein
VPGLLYAGTERGVYVSFDDGGHWQSLVLNLPPVPVHDLAVVEGDLVAATHGRSFWILDDLSPLRQLSKEVIARDAHLFIPRVAYRTQWGGGRGGDGVGANPASGATVRYWLKTANQKVTLDFLDAKGQVIRSFTSDMDSASYADSVRKEGVRTARRDSLTKAGVSADSLKKLEARSAESSTGGAEDEDAPRRAPRPPRVPNKAGTNTFVWNLRYPDASTFGGIVLWAGGTQGPVAPPGTYAVRLTSGAVTQTRPLVVRKDPRSPATLQDLAEQFALAIRIRDEVTKANDAVKTIRNLRAQVAERRPRIPTAQLASFDLLQTAMMDRLTQIENTIYQTKNQSSQDPLNYPIRLNNKLAALGSIVASADAQPTEQSYTLYEELAAQIDAQLRQLNQLMTDDLKSFNALARSADIPFVIVKPAAPAAGAPAGGGEEQEDEAPRWEN